MGRTIALCRGGSRSHRTHGSLGPLVSAPERRLDRFSSVCRAHERNQQTDRQTNRPRNSVSSKRPHLMHWVHAMRPKNYEQRCEQCTCGLSYVWHSRHLTVIGSRYRSCTVLFHSERRWRSHCGKSPTHGECSKITA